MKRLLAKEWAGSKGQNQTEGMGHVVMGHVVINNSFPKLQGGGCPQHLLAEF